MANIIFADGFESGKLDLWDVVSDVSVVAAREGHDGSYCLDVSKWKDYVQRSIPSAAENYFAFRYEPISSNSAGIMYLYKDSNIIFQLRRNSVPFIEARVGNTLVATGAVKISDNTVYRIEVYVKIADTEGKIIVRVDGVVDIDFTGDTKPGDDVEFDTVRLGYDQDVNKYSYYYIDNFVIATDDWIGDVRILALRPNADGDLLEWIASTGDRWDCIDEVPFNDSDYICTGEVNKVNLSAIENLPALANSVAYVQVQARIASEGIPVPTKVGMALKETNVYVGDGQSLPSNTKSLYHGWNKNPHTDAVWKPSEVNSLQIGVKSLA